MGLLVKSKIEHYWPINSGGFTLIEVAAALLILSLILTSAMVVMSQTTQSMIDLRSQTQAFAVARQNMEKLLSSASVTDMSEFGVLETNPDVTWQTIVEPFYEPISKRMWIRGVCVSGYTDSKGQRQTLELSCWLTGLTAEQIRQILAQQKRIEKLLEEFSQTEYGLQVAQRHQINLAFLRYKGIEEQGYKNFFEQLERRRMDYIAQYGIDEGYQELADELAQEEFDFIYRLGVNYDEYAYFYEHYDPQQPWPDPMGQDLQQQPVQDGQSAESGQSGPSKKSINPDDFPEGIPQEVLNQL